MVKTDKELYQLFRRSPDLMRELLGDPVGNRYRFRSEELKELSKRVDGFLVSETEEWAYVVEFQAHFDRRIYHRGAMEQAMLAHMYPNKKVALVLVFFEHKLDPCSEHWSALARAGHAHFRVIYLKERLAALERQNPRHHLAMVLKPIFEDQPTLENRAAVYYHHIREAPIPSQRKDNLLDIFQRLMVQGFKRWTAEEIRKMIYELAPLEETQFYKEVFAEGKEAGERRGFLEGQIKILRQLREQGEISETRFRALLASLEGPRKE